MSYFAARIFIMYIIFGNSLVFSGLRLNQSHFNGGYFLQVKNFVMPEQSFPEGVPDRTTVCKGQILRGSCPTNEVIAVKDIKYGTKLTATCGLSNNSSGCCQHDANDCLTDYTDSSQQKACSGRELCIDVSIAQADTSSCGVSYPGFNHYLTMEYYCINNDRVSSMCSGTLMNGTGSTLYLRNTDYPNPFRPTEISCGCSIQASSCSSQVKVHFVHFELNDGSGSCNGTQNVLIDDAGTSRKFTCFDNTGYTLTQQMTSSSNYIRATLNNSAGTNEGFVWIGFEATEHTAILTINCPASAQTRCLECPELANPTDGLVSLPGGRTYGQQATFSCSSGFTLNGIAVLICQADQTWSDSPPTCDISNEQTTGSSSGSRTTVSGSITSVINTPSRPQLHDPGTDGLNGGEITGILVSCVLVVTSVMIVTYIIFRCYLPGKGTHGKIAPGPKMDGQQPPLSTNLKN